MGKGISVRAPEGGSKGHSGTGGSGVFGGVGVEQPFLARQWLPWPQGFSVPGHLARYGAAFLLQLSPRESVCSPPETGSSPPLQAPCFITKHLLLLGGAPLVYRSH